MVEGLTRYEAVTVVEALRILSEAEEPLLLAFFHQLNELREVGKRLDPEKVEAFGELLYDLPRISRLSDEWSDPMAKTAAWIVDQLGALVESRETAKPVGRYGGELPLVTATFIMCDPVFADEAVEAARGGKVEPNERFMVIHTGMDGGFPVYLVRRGAGDQAGVYIQLDHEADTPLPFEPVGID